MRLVDMLTLMLSAYQLIFIFYFLLSVKNLVRQIIFIYIKVAGIINFIAL